MTGTNISRLEALAGQAESPKIKQKEAEKAFLEFLEAENNNGITLNISANQKNNFYKTKAEISQQEGIELVESEDDLNEDYSLAKLLAYNGLYFYYRIDSDLSFGSVPPSVQAVDNRRISFIPDKNSVFGIRDAVNTDISFAQNTIDSAETVSDIDSLSLGKAAFENELADFYFQSSSDSSDLAFARPDGIRHADSFVKIDGIRHTADFIQADGIRDTAGFIRPDEIENVDIIGNKQTAPKSKHIQPTGAKPDFITDLTDNGIAGESGAIFTDLEGYSVTHTEKPESFSTAEDSLTEPMAESVLNLQPEEMADYRAKKKKNIDSLAGSNFEISNSIKVFSGKENQITSAADSISTVEKLPELITLAIGEKRHQISLQLEPEGLGRLTIKIRYDAGKVSLSVIADNDNAKSLISAQISELRTALDSHQMDLVSFDITKAGEPAADGGFQPNYNNSRGDYRENSRGREVKFNYFNVEPAADGEKSMRGFYRQGLLNFFA